MTLLCLVHFYLILVGHLGIASLVLTLQFQLRGIKKFPSPATKDLLRVSERLFEDHNYALGRRVLEGFFEYYSS